MEFGSSGSLRNERTTVTIFGPVGASCKNAKPTRLPRVRNASVSGARRSAGARDPRALPLADVGSVERGDAARADYPRWLPRDRPHPWRRVRQAHQCRVASPTAQSGRGSDYARHHAPGIGSRRRVGHSLSALVGGAVARLFRRRDARLPNVDRRRRAAIGRRPGCRGGHARHGAAA